MASVLAGCTGKFEDYNTDPAAATKDQMKGDNALVGTAVYNMQRVLVQGQQNDSQMIDHMINSEYGGHIACIAHWGNSGNFYTYNPRIGWIGYMFDTMMPQIYTSFFEIAKNTEETGVVYHWAQILRVYGTFLLSSAYGPVPYTQVKDGEMTVAYDAEADLYNALFADLDEAIEGLTPVAASGEDTSILAEFDVVYNADFTKWVKFANSLKLRMAMRISNADAGLAQTKAEEAITHTLGVMTASSDAAWSSFNDGMNPYYRAEVEWNGGEIRISANVTSYLGGYNDPRLEKYAKAATYTDAEGKGIGYVGVRNGIYHSEASMAEYQKFSTTAIAASDKLLIMPASEVYFLRAEGALKGWNMGGDAKDLYEKGVAVSMEERGVQLGDYLSSEAVPADYEDPYRTTNNISAVSTVSPKWEEGANEANLERILVQKWIASFPSGWERWADFRRTGYPKMFPVVSNRNTDGVTSEGGMRRIPYSQSEYNTNPTNVEAAVGLLGGPDNGATDLWWAK